MLRLAALRTWRYFAEFSTEEHHWLIPDNVQESRPQSSGAHLADEPWIPAQRPPGRRASLAI